MDRPPTRAEKFRGNRRDRMSRLDFVLAISGMRTRRRWACFAACLAVSIGLPASGAEILDLRVTPQANSTEVVFELDEPAGYRLERTREWNRADSDELLLAINANVSESQLKALGGLVTHLTVKEDGDDPTKIRIGLREPGLLVRDSVHVSPPRLVLSISRRGGAEDAGWQGLPAAPAADAPVAKSTYRPTGALREVRVGSHPGFSRVVFELDAPASYRLDQTSSSELLLTLEARAKTQNIRSRSKYISAVRIEPGEVQSIARVRLNGDGLRIKELTLSNPDRIVLDITER